MAELPYHERLTLDNFTTFSHLTLEFVPGINVFIGQNGTGKTHVIKALYAWQMARHLVEPSKSAAYGPILLETYGARSIAELRHNAVKDTSSLAGKFGSYEWAVGMQRVHFPKGEESELVADDDVRPKTPRPIFIPAIEMMAHVRNMNGIMRDYADFDRTCFDFISIMTAQPTGAKPPKLSKDAQNLKSLVPGKVEYNESDQVFYLSENGKQIPFPLLAEGTRKISALCRLIEHNWLGPGDVLLWDEPEVNLNPQWMDEVVDVLVNLARNEVQVFLATHSYVILKQIELALRAQPQRGKRKAQARYFSFRKAGAESTATWADSFSELDPNPILDQYDKMLAEDWRLAEQAEAIL